MTESNETDGILPPSLQGISLPNFEGPLDLLLFLIRKNELDIYDIPITSVTRQYLNALKTMKELNLELAGDYFVLGATLMYIKSRMLVASHSNPDDDDPELEGEEGGDPRWELVQQLLEYRRVKEASEDLGSLIDRQIDFMPRDFQAKPEPLEERSLIPVDRLRLWQLFDAVLQRMSNRIQPGVIFEDHVTISERMTFLLEKLHFEKRFRFTELFEEKPTINMVVATFLALLELTRLRKINLIQSEDFGDIDCEAAEEEISRETSTSLASNDQNS